MTTLNPTTDHTPGRGAVAIGDLVFVSENGWTRQARVCEITPNGKRATIVWTLLSDGSYRYRTVSVARLARCLEDLEGLRRTSRAGAATQHPAPEIGPAMGALARMRAEYVQRVSDRWSRRSWRAYS